MTWWPWRRRETQTSGHVAAEAKHRAEDRLREQRRKWPEVQQAGDRFAAIVERALRGTR
jgi:hypothetical protein